MSRQPKRLLDIPEAAAAHKLTRTQQIRAFERALKGLKDHLFEHGYDQLSLQLSGPEIVAHDTKQLPQLDEVTVATWHLTYGDINSGTKYDFRSDGSATISFTLKRKRLALVTGTDRQRGWTSLCDCGWEEARRHLLRGLIKPMQVTLLAARALLTVFTPELIKDLDLPGAYAWEVKKTRGRRIKFLP